MTSCGNKSAHQDIPNSFSEVNIIRDHLSSKFNSPVLFHTPMCKACLIEFSRRTFLRELSWNAARSH